MFLSTFRIGTVAQALTPETKWSQIKAALTGHTLKYTTVVGPKQTRFVGSEVFQR